MSNTTLINQLAKKEPTKEQIAIIENENNRVVIAVPGSGKTYTLSLIIKNTLSDLPSYKGVIAISYTNKASDELKNRSLEGSIDHKCSYFGTIDSFYNNEIIRPFLPRIWGYISKEVQIIDFKNVEIIDPADLEVLDKLNKKICSLDNQALNILKKYYNKGFIFIELLGKLGLFVLEHSLSLQKYLKARYTHIIVDEYQDSGEEQHLLFLSLVRLGIIGIAVGDIDQSIFRWAGKDPQYLINLSKQKNNFKTFTLSRNHRCHPSIVNYSMRLLSPNVELCKVEENRVFSWNIIGSQVEIAKRIDELLPKIKEKYNVSNNSDIGLLVRNDTSGSIVNKNLVTDHKYIKSTTLDSDSNIWSSIFVDVLFFIFNDKQSIQSFIDKWIIHDLAQKIKSAIIKDLIYLRKINDGNFLDNIHIFKNIAQNLYPNQYSLKSLNLLKSVLENENNIYSYYPIKNNELQIMTLHKAKGLEFDIVFHLDLYNKVIPSKRAIDGNELDKKEDLNLHYVGITRAKKCCLLVTSTQNYVNYQGKLNLWNAQPSIFLSINNLPSLRT